MFDGMYISLPFLITNRNDNRKKDMMSLDMDTVNSVEGSTGFTQNGKTKPGFTSPIPDASNGSRAKVYPEGEDSAGLYAMPDMSAKTSLKSKTPDHASSYDNAGYATPAGVDNMEGEEDFSALYATSSKHQPVPEGGNTEETGDMYAVPDKNKKSRTSNMNGLNAAASAVPDEDVAALYAMPDKRKTVDQDETVMIDNELYSSM